MKSQENKVQAPRAAVRVLVAGKTGGAAFKKAAASPVKAEAAGGCVCHFSF